MSAHGWDPAGSDGNYRYSTAALSVFWPAAEYAKLTARWPHLAAEVGETWDEHRHSVERHCATIERAGHVVKQLPGSVEGLAAFVAARGGAEPAAPDLAAYPDLRTVTVPMTAWPPERTAPCWCGSGRKYKRCCRPYGLGDLDVPAEHRA